MSLSPIALRTLSASRILIGVPCLLVPLHLGPLFGLPIAPESTIVARLLSIRELLLGVYLWRTTTAYLAKTSHETTTLTGESEKSSDGISMTQLRQHDLTTAVWFGVIVDTVDALSCVACVAEGNLTDLAKGWVMGGAVVFAGIGMWQLSVLRSEY